MQKFLSVRQVAKRYDVSAATVWRWAQHGIIPAPIKLSPGCTRWPVEQLEAHDAQRTQTQGAA